MPSYYILSLSQEVHLLAGWMVGGWMSLLLFFYVHMKVVHRSRDNKFYFQTLLNKYCCVYPFCFVVCTIHPKNTIMCKCKYRLVYTCNHLTVSATQIYTFLPIVGKKIKLKKCFSII